MEIEAEPRLQESGESQEEHHRSHRPRCGLSSRRDSHGGPQRGTAEVQVPFEEDDEPVQRRLHREDTHQDRGGGCKRSPRDRTGGSERNVADMLGMRTRREEGPEREGA